MKKKQINKKKQETNTLAIIGFILSLTIVFSLVGIVLSIIAIFQINKKKQKGMGLAIGGIVIGFVFPVLLIGLVTFGLFAFYGSGGIIGSGNVISETYDLSGFERVHIDSGLNLIVTQGEDYLVRIEAEDNVLELLEVEVSGKDLNVGPEDFVWLQDTKPVMVYVTMPEVSALSVLGSGDIKSEGLIVSERLSLKIAGSGNIELVTKTSDLISTVSGSGDIILTGETDEYEAVIEGSGSISSFDLIAKNVEARILGSGDMELYASETLDVLIRGSGDVKYKGGATVSQKIEGSGDISAIGGDNEEDSEYYISCGCGCCGGNEPAEICLEEGVTFQDMRDREVVLTDEDCANVGCSFGVKYIYCD